MKRVVGILNRERPIEWVNELLDASAKQTVNVDDYIISTDRPSRYENVVSSDNVLDNTDENIAQSKNRIIKRAREIGADFLILIEDDVVILRNDAFDHYINAMLVLKTNIMFNGYTNQSNYILTLPSARTKVILGDLCEKLPSVIANRHECGDFIVIDLNTNNVEFNDELSYFEFSEYVFKCYGEDMIPGLNMFLDIPDAWTYMKCRHGCTSLRTGGNASFEKDKKKMDETVGNLWKIENNLKTVVDWVRGRVGV